MRPVISNKRQTRRIPHAPARFFNLALSLQQSGDLEGATQCYYQAIWRDPHYAEAWNNLGVVHAIRAESSQALAAFLRALEINPNYEEACHNAQRAAQIVGTTPAVLEHCGAAGNTH